MGFQDIVMVDNASSFELLIDLKASVWHGDLPQKEGKELRYCGLLERNTGYEWKWGNFARATQGESDLKVIRFGKHWERGQEYDYPYGWRTVHAARMVAEAYDKIIFIDSDGFVLSRRLANWIKELNDGWHALWCPKYSFPEANCHILTREHYPAFFKFTEGDPYQHNNTGMMENILPFTHVHREFVSNRYGEWGEPQHPTMDFYAQARTMRRLEFDKFALIGKAR